jgi:hypothetical protein
MVFTQNPGFGVLGLPQTQKSTLDFWGLRQILSHKMTQKFALVIFFFYFLQNMVFTQKPRILGFGVADPPQKPQNHPKPKGEGAAADSGQKSRFP